MSFSKGELVRLTASALKTYTGMNPDTYKVFDVAPSGEGIEERIQVVRPGKEPGPVLGWIRASNFVLASEPLSDDWYDSLAEREILGIAPGEDHHSG